MRLRQKGKEKLVGCRVRGTYSCVAGIALFLGRRRLKFGLPSLHICNPAGVSSV